MLKGEVARADACLAADFQSLLLGECVYLKVTDPQRCGSGMRPYGKLWGRGSSRGLLQNALPWLGAGLAVFTTRTH